MAHQKSKGAIFSPEALESQLSTLEVLAAMWAGNDELSIPSSTSEGIEALARYLALPLSTLGDEECINAKDAVPNDLNFTLSIDPLAGSEGDRSRHARKARKLKLEVTLLLRKLAPGQAESEAICPRLRLRRSEWLNAVDHMRICKEAGINEGAKHGVGKMDIDGGSYVLETVERISEAAATIMANDLETETQCGVASENGHASLSKLVYRSWSCLPSLSTKEKRQDLVDYAKLNRPPLTGFVLAGKPALVVLEHPLTDELNLLTEGKEAQLLAAQSNILAYWSSIKVQSWSDIPSGHKKVSETLVERAVPRVFSNMTDTTGSDEIGGREALRGTYKHRNDWKLVEGWLKGKQCGGRLKEALGADWN
ncbi:hypothetical protein K437DRAFT_218815 [Tilletiaria anomala UBC 951]|uniref:Uncharacterized protein n=1 Tax=Tilletiaria anomala (strain ATCC 24038 / CBS 436.72 / UBC 951) TaxID=1037660 RepID=A0A066WSI0_TILAU|nr:uncharacterized protein K437DRAFT_218815 [Tilletiaria anomala UBC 951]KDN53640.1 hypothetical protein K437DRAFT_218815 [Tilletiaria anomala UBC 951]